MSLPTLKLFSPPPDNEDPTAPRTGITAWQFPEWFITQDVERGDRGGMTRSRLLVHRKALTKGKFIDDDKQKHPVVPVRFVRACRKGHIGDIDWYWFVHQRQSARAAGSSGSTSAARAATSPRSSSAASAVRQRPSDATPPIPGTLGHCDGARPWLGPYTQGERATS